MKPNSYKCIKTDPAAGIFEGQTITPYYEDDNEIIVSGPRVDTDHHIRKNGSYFTQHLQPIGGN